MQYKPPPPTPPPQICPPLVSLEMNSIFLNNILKPKKLSKFKKYFDQLLFSLFYNDFF